MGALGFVLLKLFYLQGILKFFVAVFDMYVLQRENRLFKRVLRKMYYSPQSKNSISLEVGVEKNNFSQIQLLEIFYVLVDTRQNQKKKIPGLPCP